MINFLIRLLFTPYPVHRACVTPSNYTAVPYYFTPELIAHFVCLIQGPFLDQILISYYVHRGFFTPSCILYCLIQGRSLDYITLHPLWLLQSTLLHCRIQFQTLGCIRAVQNRFNLSFVTSLLSRLGLS